MQAASLMDLRLKLRAWKINRHHPPTTQHSPPETPSSVHLQRRNSNLNNMPDNAVPKASKFERLKAKFPCYRSKAKAHSTLSQPPAVDDASKRTDEREELPEAVSATQEDQELNPSDPGKASVVPEDKGLGPNDRQPAPGSLWNKAFQELPKKASNNWSQWAHTKTTKSLWTKIFVISW